MEKNWIKLGLSLHEIKNLNEEEKKKLLLVVTPIIEKLKEKNILETFHFFFEPFLDLRFQIKKEDDIPKAKEFILSLINQELPKEKIFVISKNGRFFPKNSPEFSEYFGEEEDFGKDGWMIAKKFFEIGSRFALCKMDENKDRVILKKVGGVIEGKFDEGKFIHLILNQLGYSTPDEAQFHLNRFFERLMRIYGSYDKAFEEFKRILEKIKNDQNFKIE